MVARGAPTERGPGPRGRRAQSRTLAPERIGGWAELGPRCAALRVRLLICSAAAAAAAAARSQVRSEQIGRDSLGSGL